MAKDYNLKAVISAVDRISPVLRGINGAVKATRASLGTIAGAGRNLQAAIGGAIAPIGAVVGGLGAAGFVGTVGKIVSVSAEFEKFQTILETVEGSAEKAKGSMQWVSDFATKTPYELAEVTDAYVKLKSYGIDPVSGALQSAGDAAAGMGKPLEQAVEALADAMTGENERLKQFGIVAKKVGDNIVYTWSENGRTIAAKVKANNRAAIQATIQGIWNKQFGGAMEKLSRTWTGLWSNMQDAMARFALSIGNAGLFQYLKDNLQGLLNTLNRWAENGQLQAISAEISNNLVGALEELKSIGKSAFEWARTVEWKKLYSDIKDVGAALGGVKGIVLGLGVILAANLLFPLLQIGGALVRLLPLLGSFFAWLVPLNWGAVFTGIAASVLKAAAAVRALGMAFLATPWGAVIAAVAFVAVEVYRNWDAIVAYVGKAWERIKAVFEVGWFQGFLQIQLEAFQAFGNGIVGIIKDLLPESWMPEALRNFHFEFAARNADIVQGMSGPSPQGVDARPSLPAQMAAGQAALQAQAMSSQGELRVRFDNAPPGMRVEQPRVRGPLSLSTDVGYSTLMSGGAY